MKEERRKKKEENMQIKNNILPIYKKPKKKNALPTTRVRRERKGVCVIYDCLPIVRA
jgi:hypothetical protein